jgi:hypothetical protein
MSKFKKIIIVVFSITTSMLASCGGGTVTSTSDEKNAYKFDLTNRVAQGIPAECNNSIVAFEVKFSQVGLQWVRGTDSVNLASDGSCTANQTDTSEIGLVLSYKSVKEDGFLIPCGGSVCSYSQLNSTYTGIDVDGRAWTQVVSHVKDSNEIVTTKSWVEGKTTKESKTTLKFIEETYFIDLTGKTASVFAMKCTPPIEAFKLQFSASGLSFISGTDSVNEAPNGSCTANPTDPTEVGTVFRYADAKRDGFIVPCGSPICTLMELNSTFSGVDGDGNAWTQVVSHTKGSKEILSVKSRTQLGVNHEISSLVVFD